MLRCACLLYMIVHHALIFHATLYMFSVQNVFITLKSVMPPFTCLLCMISHHAKILQRYGTMFLNGKCDTIIAIPCDKWCPKFWKNLKHEMLQLRMRKVETNRVRYGPRCLVHAGGPKTERVANDAYFRQRTQNRACNTNFSINALSTKTSKYVANFSNHVHGVWWVGVGWGINVLSAKNFEVRYSLL